MDLFSLKHSFGFQTATTDMKVYQTAFYEPRMEISLILEGRITFVIDGQVRHVDAPAVTFQAYRESLIVSVPKDRRTRTMWCHFSSLDVSEAAWDWMQQLPTVQAVPESLPSLFAAALSLPHASEAANAEAPDYGDQVRSALGAAIFTEYVRQAKCPRPAPSVPAAVRAVKRAIDESYLTAWNVDELAQIAGTNGNYLIHLFKKHVGESPIRYLWNRRVQAGLHLLQTTDLSIDDVSYQCGFQTAAHFSRSVKERTGKSPSLLRRAPSTLVAWAQTA